MRSLRALVGAVLVAALAACGSTPVAQKLTEPFRIIKHAMGETTIPAQPKRVVALDQSFVDAVLTLRTPVVSLKTVGAILDSLS